MRARFGIAGLAAVIGVTAIVSGPLTAQQNAPQKNAGARKASDSRSSPTIQGVWKVTEVTTTGPTGRTIANVQPRLVIVTRGYYSRTEDWADGPRPPIANAGNASADELRATWGPFLAEAGTYQLENGNLVTVRALVAKGPAQMATDAYAISSYRLEGDTLWLTNQRTQNGPVQNPTTYKLTRLE